MEAVLARWKMPSDLENYISLYNDADKAAREFNILVGEIVRFARQLEENPTVARTPPLNWPTPHDITQAYQKYTSAREVATAKYNTLPADQKPHARTPGSIGAREKRRR